MLKRRLILLLCFSDEVLFRTKWFRPDYRYTANFVDLGLADEIAAVNVSRGTSVFSPEFIAKRFEKWFGPLGLGGHVRSLDDAKHLIRDYGGEKVIVNRLELVEPCARQFGSQSVTFGLDYREIDSERRIFTHSGTKPAGATLGIRAAEAEAAGAGELLVNSIDRDGSLQGYDLPALFAVCDNAKVPVVAAGGCGNWSHIKEAFEAGCTGAATSCIFHLTKPSLTAAKSWLRNQGCEVRI